MTPLTTVYLGILILLFWLWIVFKCWHGIIQSKWSITQPNEVRVQYGDRD